MIDIWHTNSFDLGFDCQDGHYNLENYTLKIPKI